MFLRGIRFHGHGFSGGNQALLLLLGNVEVRNGVNVDFRMNDALLSGFQLRLRLRFGFRLRFGLRLRFGFRLRFGLRLRFGFQLRHLLHLLAKLLLVVSKLLLLLLTKRIQLLLNPLLRVRRDCRPACVACLRRVRRVNHHARLIHDQRGRAVLRRHRIGRAIRCYRIGRVIRCYRIGRAIRHRIGRALRCYRIGRAILHRIGRVVRPRRDADSGGEEPQNHAQRQRKRQRPPASLLHVSYLLAFRTVPLPERGIIGQARFPSSPSIIIHFSGGAQDVFVTFL